MTTSTIRDTMRPTAAELLSVELVLLLLEEVGGA